MKSCPNKTQMTLRGHYHWACSPIFWGQGKRTVLQTRQWDLLDVVKLSVCVRKSPWSYKGLLVRSSLASGEDSSGNNTKQHVHNRQVLLHCHICYIQPLDIRLLLPVTTLHSTITIEHHHEPLQQSRRTNKRGSS